MSQIQYLKDFLDNLLDIDKVKGDVNIIPIYRIIIKRTT